MLWRQQGLPWQAFSRGWKLLIDLEVSQAKVHRLSIPTPNTSQYLNQLLVKVMALRASLNLSAMLYLKICHSGCAKMPPVLPLTVSSSLSHSFCHGFCILHYFAFSYFTAPACRLNFS